MEASITIETEIDQLALCRYNLTDAGNAHPEAVRLRLHLAIATGEQKALRSSCPVPHCGCHGCAKPGFHLPEHHHQ